MAAELGIIEGFYGRPWSWEAKAEVAARVAQHGYRFYIYAPKADAFLRKRWLEAHPKAEDDGLRRLSTRCRALGLRFGVGLSPFEIYRNFDVEAQAALAS